MLRNKYCGLVVFHIEYRCLLRFRVIFKPDKHLWLVPDKAQTYRNFGLTIVTVVCFARRYNAKNPRDWVIRDSLYYVKECVSKNILC